MAEDYKIVISVEGDNKLSPTIRVASGDLKRFAQDTKDATNQTGQFERQTQSMTNTLRQFAGGVLGGIALREVVGFAEEMNELGTQVNANRVLFDQLTRTIGGSASTLRELRSATGDVVSDMELMAGANQLLRLGVTETADQTAMLIGQIQRLKQPTESTADAIQNFALMLSNESLLRLDSFGISSANVKRRMDELGQSFREATMAEMAGQIDRLGSAADVAITPLARIQTALDNIRESAGANINTGVNSLAGFLLALYDVSQSNYDLVSRAQQVIDAAGVPQSNTLRLPFQNLVPTDQADAQVAARATVRWFDDMALAINRAVNPLRDWIDGVREARIAEIAAFTGREDMRSMYAIFDQVDANIGLMRSLSGEYMTQSDAAQVLAQAEQIAAAAAFAKDEFKDLLSDADLADLQHAVDISKELATAAQRSADAFDKITLSQLFGQTGGGLGGQITDRIIASMQGTMSAEELDALRTWLDLQTGRETNASQSFANDVLPLFQSLYQQGGAGDVITAMDNLTKQLELYALSGTPLPSDLSTMLGFRWTQEGGTSFTVRSGDTPSGIAAETGLTLEQIAAASGWIPGQNWTFQAGTYQIGGAEPIPGFNVDALQGVNLTLEDIHSNADMAFDVMAQTADSVVSSAENIRGILEDLSGSVHKVTIDLDVRTSPLLQWLFTQSGGGRDWLSKIVTDNGGVVPGTKESIP